MEENVFEKAQELRERMGFITAIVEELNGILLKGGTIESITVRGLGVCLTEKGDEKGVIGIASISPNDSVLGKFFPEKLIRQTVEDLRTHYKTVFEKLEDEFKKL